MPKPCLPRQARVQELLPPEVALPETYYMPCARRFAERGEQQLQQQKKKPELTTEDAEGKGDNFHKADNCLMIFGGPVACESKCR